VALRENAVVPQASAFEIPQHNNQTHQYINNNNRLLQQSFLKDHSPAS
jgi:hypothetical protein